MAIPAKPVVSPASLQPLLLISLNTHPTTLPPVGVGEGTVGVGVLVGVEVGVEVGVLVGVTHESGLLVQVLAA